MARDLQAYSDDLQADSDALQTYIVIFKNIYLQVWIRNAYEPLS